MKILQVIANAEYGGLPLHVLTLSKSLIARGHDVRLLSMGEGPLVSQFEKAGILVEVIACLGQKARRDPLTAVRVTRSVRQAIRQSRPDVVHSHGPRAHLFVGIANQIAGRPPLVGSVHGSFRQFTSGMGAELSPMGKRIKRLQYGNIDRLMGRLADRLVAVCEATRQELVHDLKVPARKVAMVHNGIEEQSVDSGRLMDIRREFGLNGSERVAVYIGGLSYHKGVQDLVEAAITVFSHEPKARFLLVGEGPMEEDLRRRVANGDLPGNILIAGRRSDAVAIIATGDMLILPSLSEGLSLTLLEAAMLGKPMVATTVGGNSDVVVEGKTGLLVEPHDPAAIARSVLALMDDDEKRQKLGAAARALWEREYTVEHMVSGMEALYGELVA